MPDEPDEIGGPKLRAVDPWSIGTPRHGRQLLSEEQRARLMAIVSVVRFRKHEQIYAAGDTANAIFNVISGVVKIYRRARDGSEYVSSFLYSEDLFGLSEEGYYVNSAKAITPVTAYLLPWPTFQRQLSEDAELEFQMIVKLFHGLREAQRHAVLLAQKHAISKVAIFLRLQEHIQSARGFPPEIYLPMDRSDVAAYVGMSLAAVSRGFHTLKTRGVIKYGDRHHVKIIDRKAFDMLTRNVDS
jgi:CRP-like cAMP-binding protein